MLIFGSTIFVNELTSIWAVLILVICWILIDHKYKYGGKSNYYICLVLLLITPVLLRFNLFLRAERAGVWIYYFFIIGFLQTLFANFPLQRESKQKNNV